MISVYQDKKDNCFQACVASVLDVALENVPHFFRDGIETQDAHNEFVMWLKDRGLGYVMIVDEQCLRNVSLPVYHFIIGKNKIDGINHCVVGYDGKVIHDPSPKKVGIKRAERYEIIIMSEPALFIAWKENLT